MKNRLYVHLLISLGLWWMLPSCQSPVSQAWNAFVKCASNDCVAEALAVKDALLKDPKAMLTQFDKTYAKGEDHVVGWLHILQDSVLGNPAYETEAVPNDLRQALINSLTSWENDPKLGEMARSILSFLREGAQKEAFETEELMPVTGTYAYELPDNQGTGSLEVSRASSEAIRFKLLIVGGAPAFNHGLLEGEARLTAPNVYEYATKQYGGPCRISFTFRYEEVEAYLEEGNAANCGLGNGISVDQKLARKSFDDPFLQGKDAQVAKNLQGEWVAVDDPQSSIVMKDGSFFYFYGTEPQGSFPYQYYPKCPGECAAPAATPCVSVIGQDILCYAVVKADGQNLELSLISGAGKTLVYKRK